MCCASNAFGCPGLTAKGRRNRLTAISRTPAPPEANSSGGLSELSGKGVSVQRRVSYVLLSVLSLGLAHPVCAYGAAAQDRSSSSSAISSEPDCGKSVEDALKTARVSLAANDPAHDHSALACLLSAVEALNAQRLDVTRGKAGAQAHVLAVPIELGKGP